MSDTTRTEELRRLYASAHRAPWTRHSARRTIKAPHPKGDPDRLTTVASTHWGPGTHETHALDSAALIIAMHEALPALLDVVEAAQAIVADCKKCRSWPMDGLLKVDDALARYEGSKP